MTGDKDFDETLEECFRVLGVKGKDYTIGSKDQLANFRMGAEFFGITSAQVLGVYLHKHVAAVFNYIKTGGQSESEPIQGRITDVVNYCLLLSKMLKEEARGSRVRDDSELLPAWYQDAARHLAPTVGEAVRSANTAADVARPEYGKPMGAQVITGAANAPAESLCLRCGVAHSERNLCAKPRTMCPRCGKGHHADRDPYCLGAP